MIHESSLMIFPRQQDKENVTFLYSVRQRKGLFLSTCQVIVCYKHINPEKVELFFNECRNFLFLSSMTYKEVRRIRE